MLVNLTDVFTSEGKVTAIQTKPALDAVEIGGSSFPVKAVSPMDLTFSNIGKGKVRLTGSVEVVLSLNCDRCLKPVDHTMALSFDREVLSPDVLEDGSDEMDDQKFMDGYQLDTDDYLHIEIVINWPMKVLCRPDCRGICRQCGKDLNTGTCGCDVFVPDPRMAAIKDIFNGNKEV